MKTLSVFESGQDTLSVKSLNSAFELAIIKSKHEQ